MNSVCPLSKTQGSNAITYRQAGSTPYDAKYILRGTQQAEACPMPGCGPHSEHKKEAVAKQPPAVCQKFLLDYEGAQPEKYASRAGLHVRRIIRAPRMVPCTGFA